MPTTHVVEKHGDVIFLFYEHEKLEDYSDSSDCVVEPDNPNDGQENSSIGAFTSGDEHNGNVGIGTYPEAMDVDFSVRIQVSSARLSASSPVFAAMLNTGFQESTTLRTQGFVEIPLPEDDPEAFLIIMKVMHTPLAVIASPGFKFPALELKELLDKYMFSEMVRQSAAAWLYNNAFYPDKWPNRNDLRFEFKSRPNTPWVPQERYHRLLWMYWILGLQEKFNHFVQLAVGHSTRPISLRDRHNVLLIPEYITKSIERMRIDLLKRIGEEIISTFYRHHRKGRCTCHLSEFHYYRPFHYCQPYAGLSLSQKLENNGSLFAGISVADICEGLYWDRNTTEGSWIKKFYDRVYWAEDIFGKMYLKEEDIFGEMELRLQQLRYNNCLSDMHNLFNLSR